MTQKELLYVEDAIKHEQTIIDVCYESINMLEDEDLCSFMKSEVKKHLKTKEKLMRLLEGVCDE